MTDDDGLAYVDLADAVLRGGLTIADSSDDERPAARKPSGVSDFYTMRFAQWHAMVRDLRGQVLADAGSIRRTAKVLGVPRSTLGAWVARDHEHG